MLRGKYTNTALPVWKLMMKNIYYFGGYHVQAKDFRMQVFYEDKDKTLTNFLPVPSEKNMDGISLIHLLGLDRFNAKLDPKPDGYFDFLEGYTINSSQGRIIFPVLEPFGKDLLDCFHDKPLGESFVYDSLYTTTQSAARQQSDKTNFILRALISAQQDRIYHLMLKMFPEAL